MRYKTLLMLLCVPLFVLSGCGKQQQYDSKWKSYNLNNPGQWQVNYDKYITDSDTEFQWTLYVGNRSKSPDYTAWTTQTSWKLISSKQAKAELGDMWRLVPQGHDFYFYVLSMPQAAWYVPGTPDTMVGVATSSQNASNGKRLVHDVIYRNITDAPILVATMPLQLTSITTNQEEPSITFTWNSLS